MAKIVITRRIHPFVTKKLRMHHDVWQNAGPSPIARKELLKRMPGCDGLLCMPYDVIDSKIIDASQNLRTISTFSVGYEHIDVKYAKSRGISVGYTPDVLSEATANMAFALILDITRGVSRGDRIVRSKNWNTVFAPQQLCGTELSRKTLGILGMGRIGILVAERASAFGMKIAYHNRHRLSASVEKKIGAKYRSISALFSGCDILSLHVPHTVKTHHIVNEKTFSKMRRGSYIVNTSRGAIIDEKSLICAVKNGRIRGAGLDVFETEPLRVKNPLVKLENVTLVPHLGTATEETREGMAKITLENLLAGIAGNKIPHEVLLPS